jgi:hypothetical protein
MPKDVSSKMVASSQDLGSPVTSGTLTVQQFEEGARAFATQAWPSLELRLLLGSSASTPGNATGTKQSLDTQQLKQHEESIAQEAACTTDGSRRADAVLPKAVIASQWQVVDITACAPSINPLLGRQQVCHLILQISVLYQLLGQSEQPGHTYFICRHTVAFLSCSACRPCTCVWQTCLCHLHCHPCSSSSSSSQHLQGQQGGLLQWRCQAISSSVRQRLATGMKPWQKLQQRTKLPSMAVWTCTSCGTPRTRCQR